MKDIHIRYLKVIKLSKGHVILPKKIRKGPYYKWHGSWNHHMTNCTSAN